MSEFRVLVFTGSLRRQSLNGMLARSLPSYASDALAFDYFGELATLPHYDEDLDHETPPPSVIRLRAAVAAADALYWATPEFNHTMPAIIKNAIEWISHPLQRAALVGKISAIAVATQGRGGYRGMADLARVLRDLGGFVICAPEVCIQFAQTIISQGAAGAITYADPLAERLLRVQLDSLERAIRDRSGDHGGAAWRAIFANTCPQTTVA